jgi:hypothetical protein
MMEQFLPMQHVLSENGDGDAGRDAGRIATY